MKKDKIQEAGKWHPETGAIKPENILTPSEAFTNDIWVTSDKVLGVETYAAVVKDYEERKEGYKETEGKLDYSEINFELLDLMAKRFMENKKKYPKGNTKKALDKDEILWAAFRHIRKMLQPIKNDPETYEDHLAAVATNCSIILDQLRK